MGRTFGKYRSRRGKKEPKKAEPEPEPEPETEPDTDTETEESEENPKGGALDDYLGQMHKDSAGAHQGLLPNRLHVPSLDHDLLAKTVSVLDNHEFKGLKHAAHYIVGNHAHAPSIFHHRHRASQPMKHFQKIAESTRDELAHHLAGDGTMHRAVHEAMHSAHLGGGFNFSHARHIAEHLTEPVGGSFDLNRVVKAAKQLANPIEQLKAAKNEYDSVNLNDWSAEGMARNAGHAFAGNTRVAAAHMKATSIAAPEAAPMLLPASEGFVGLSKAASYSTKML